MTSAFIDKLASQTRCPVCGRDRMLADQSPEGVDRPIAMARFECGGHFIADATAITVSSPCGAGSRLAVRLMTIEAEGRCR
jgi:hypothetical protein